MVRLHRAVAVLGMAAAFGLSVQAAELEGYLMDKMCSAKVASEGVNAAKMHTRECALMDPCKESGFGVVTSDGKFHALDDAGNEKAVAALEGSKKKDNLRVKVTGEQNGDTFKVMTLKLM